MLELVIFIIVIALLFDFGNGMHDAANAIATVVSTRVLTPQKAVVLAAVMNFIAAFGFGVAVATTIGKGIVMPSGITEYVILAALLGAIVWVFLTMFLGLPISSSHALIGGLVGASVVHAGWGVVIFGGLLKVALFIFIAPVAGFILGFLFMLITTNIFHDKSQPTMNKLFGRLQLLSASLYSLGHGTNDAQKTMGIIAILLYNAGYLGQTFYVPFYVVLMAHAAIALGTLLGGWRIVETMGMKITKLAPVHGFCAECAGAITIITSSIFGIPVSTTHTISGSIMGVGALRRLSAVRWGVARRIVLTWILTIPCSAGMSALIYWIINMFI
jgi:PiT family inorganic phosphate transporter